MLTDLGSSKIIIKQQVQSNIHSLKLTDVEISQSQGTKSVELCVFFFFVHRKFVARGRLQTVDSIWWCKWIQNFLTTSNKWIQIYFACSEQSMRKTWSPISCSIHGRYCDPVTSLSMSKNSKPFNVPYHRCNRRKGWFTDSVVMTTSNWLYCSTVSEFRSERKLSQNWVG